MNADKIVHVLNLEIKKKIKKYIYKMFFISKKNIFAISNH
jgi:hypothetical protein